MIATEHLPLLGTRKTDYAAVTRLAEQRLAASPGDASPPEPALSLVSD